MFLYLTAAILLLANGVLSNCQKNEDENKTVCKTLDINPDLSPTNLVIEGATGSLTQDSLSNLDQVSEITIAESYLDHIDEGALCSSPNLATLGLFRNKRLPKLGKSELENCRRLKAIYIEDATIEQGAFSKLKGVERVSLSRTLLPRTTLTKEMMAGLERTKFLILRESGLDKIEKDALENMPLLEFLNLQGNNIDEIAPGTFQNLGNLRVMDLSNNTLSDLNWSAFQGLTSLEVLCLERNGIADINIDLLLANLPRLERVFLDGHKFTDEEMQAINRKFRESDVNVIYV